MSNLPRASRSPGRALLVLLALCFVLGITWLWYQTSERPGGRRAAPLPAAPVAPSEPRADPASTLDQRMPAELARGESDELEPFVPVLSSEPGLRGKLGSLRGHIEVAGEEDFPMTWRLIARPSMYLAGREQAVEQRLEFNDGRRDFELPQLPLGAYDVLGEAEGFNGPALPIKLQPGNEHPFVTLSLVPAGLLEGLVLDAEGLAAEDVPITLFDQAGQSAREATTDAGGVFRFEKLPDGAYELLVGKGTAPLMPERRPVRFVAPHMTFPDIELPQLGTLHVRVVDSLARPLEGVEVRGTGTKGGVIEGHTDFNGSLVTKYLPAGHFRLRLEHSAFGSAYARRIAVDVVTGKVTEAPVRLGP